MADMYDTSDELARLGRIPGANTKKNEDKNDCITRDVNDYDEYCETHRQDASLCHLNTGAALDNYLINYEEPK